MSVDVLAELAALRARMDAVEHQIAPRPLRRADREALARILPALAGSVGSECFLASEAVASKNPALVLVLAGMNARRLRRLLRRADGVEVCGHVARARGMEGGAVLWSVLRASERR